MTRYRLAKYSKAQIKIQQMAFVIIALVIFFTMVGLVFLSIYLPNLKGKAVALQDEEAKEIVRKLSGSPEFAFTSGRDCSSCIDFDKVFILKDLDAYDNFWNLNYLAIRKIYPEPLNEECTDLSTYPDCGKIVLIDKGESLNTKTAFVSLVHWDPSAKEFIYELGKVEASGRRI